MIQPHNGNMYVVCIKYWNIIHISKNLKTFIHYVIIDIEVFLFFAFFVILMSQKYQCIFK